MPPGAGACLRSVPRVLRRFASRIPGTRRRGPGVGPSRRGECRPQSAG
jgi:hypothetical protein